MNVPFAVYSIGSKTFASFNVVYDSSKARPDGYMQVRVPYTYLADMGLNVYAISFVKITGAQTLKDSMFLSSFRFYTNLADVPDPEPLEKDDLMPDERDEYLDDNGKRIPDCEEFSFKHIMNDSLYSKINADLIMPEEQRIFPDPDNTDYIPEIIEKLGGVDIAFGGVALNGHIAFNEPEPNLSKEEFLNLSTRIVTLTPETRIKDAILGRGGAVDTVPTTAITVGIKEILGSKKVRLSMMNQMQRAVVRKACLMEVSTSCPVSFIQDHNDACLYVLNTVTEKPF